LHPNSSTPNTVGPRILPQPLRTDQRVILRQERGNGAIG
jgi:hypothetical protein